MKVRKKIIIVDPVHPILIKNLRKKNYKVDYKPGIKYSNLFKIIKFYSIIILRSGIKLDKNIINKGKDLKIIARAGVGMDNIDLLQAKKNKIKCFNVPAQSASSVAELAFGLLHSASRKIVYCDRLLRKNLWKKSDIYGFEITKKNLGIIGLGKIGKKIALLGKKYGMNIYANVKRNSLKRKKLLKRKKIFLLTLNQLLKKSDFVIVSVPLLKDTFNLINKKKLNLMKKNSILINVSRGGIVNEQDLYNHLKIKRIFAAASDVFLHEKRKNKLFKLNNAVFTAHIGAMTFEAQKRIAIELEKRLIRY